MFSAGEILLSVASFLCILIFIILRSCCDTDKVTNCSTNNEDIEISTNLDINLTSSTPETVGNYL